MTPVASTSVEHNTAVLTEQIDMVALIRAQEAVSA